MMVTKRKFVNVCSEFERNARKKFPNYKSMYEITKEIDRRFLSDYKTTYIKSEELNKRLEKILHDTKKKR